MSYNFKCIICSESCKIRAEILVTNCGHVFHNDCLKKKHEGEPQCPQCLEEVKTTTNLRLKFESEPSTQDFHIAELKSEGDHLYSSLKKLQEQYEASERTLSHSQAQNHQLKNRIDYLTRQNADFTKDIINKNKDIQELQYLKTRNNELERKIATTEINCPNLQKEYNKKDKELNQAKKDLEKVTLENQKLSKDIAAQHIEIQTLKNNPNGKSSQVSSAAREAQMNVLKEKNIQLSSELFKEIRYSSQMAVEKLRLDNLLKELKLEPQQHKNESLSETKETETNDTVVDPKSKFCKETAPSVIIRNIKEVFADKPSMKKYIFGLFQIMELNFADEDVLDVSCLSGRKGQEPGLAVKFKTSRLQTLVLSNCDKLKMKSETKNLVVKERILNPRLDVLYLQATALKSVGYKKVFIRNDAVFVSRTKFSAPIRIKSKSDIDRLANKA